MPFQFNGSVTFTDAGIRVCFDVSPVPDHPKPTSGEFAENPVFSVGDTVQVLGAYGRSVGDGVVLHTVLTKTGEERVIVELEGGSICVCPLHIVAHRYVA